MIMMVMMFMMMIKHPQRRLFTQPCMCRGESQNFRPDLSLSARVGEDNNGLWWCTTLKDILH